MFEERSFSKCKLHGTINDISIDFNTRKPKISILLDTNNTSDIEELKNENKLNIELKKYRKKRSLDANSYCWVICEKIAQEISKDGTIVTKEDIYKDAIMTVGRFVPFIVEEIAFDRFKEIWERQGLGYQVQETARKNKYVRVNCYYGSSSYDTKEMSRLIDLIVQEAKQYNIETMTPSELSRLKEEWNNDSNKSN